MVDDLPEPNATATPEIDAGKPEVGESRSALVQEYLGYVTDAESHWKPVFDQMRENQEFAAHGADKMWVKAKKYRVPIIARHINQEVDTLYARTPRIVGKRKRKLMYKLWDGRSDSLEMAMQSAMAMPPDPTAVQLLSEVVAVRRMEKMLDRMANTIEILWSYFLDEQSANYKQQIKALVRRVKVCKVGFIKLGYQRVLQPRPEVIGQIEDVTSKLAAVQCLLEKAQSGELQDHEAKAEELRLLLQDLQSQPEMVVREGPVLDFPRSNAVIIDPDCFHLKSLAGAKWIAFVYEMSADEIYDIYKVKIGDPKEETAYASSGRKAAKGKRKKHRVYEFWNKRLQQVSTFTPGWPDFLKEPASPDVEIERFWPLFPVVFNEVEHDEMLYPPSDVEQAKDIQMEYNRSREALRQHRIAARPYYVEGGRLEDDDKKRLAYHDDHEVITVKSLAPNEKVENLVQRGPTAPIDPNLYEVEMHFQDLLRVVGTQEANLGGVSGGTATESSIAESSRDKSDSSSVDDLDEVLTDLSRAAVQVMLLNMTKDAVIEIVGDGAVWPDSPETRAVAAKELTVDIEAGSSGRPNKAADLADLERVTPLLLQIPGIQPTPIGRKLAELIDLDPDELVADGNPSITAINAMLSKMAGGTGAPQPGTGDPATDPNQQGGQGGQNAPQPQMPAPGPQPAYPAPGAATGGAALTSM